jgi:4-amino-4-deoxy-L-arabinose transferase-like glycosyltransferase
MEGSPQSAGVPGLPGAVDRRDLLLIVALSAIAGLLLFAHLGSKYLWQDEAATAVMGDRMMRYGKPLAYDGKNIITMDNFAEEDHRTIGSRTASAESALDYLIARRDFRSDTAWTGQPWGQFVVAGASIRLFGRTTVAARAPFAAAAVLTVALFYVFVRRAFDSRLMAAIATAFVILNTYWILHARQCRYYALSSLFLVLTTMAYARWRRGLRFGPAAFVVAAWFWFQSDFGTFWPVIGVYLGLAAWSSWPRVRSVVFVAAALAVSIAPWVWYYELIGRVKTTAMPWPDKLSGNVFHMNQFVMPLALLAAAALLLRARWPSLPPLRRQLLLAGALILIASIYWVTAVAPWSFHRYLVSLTPLGALLLAWLVMEAAAWAARDRRAPAAVVASVAAALLIATPLASNVVSSWLPRVWTNGHPIGFAVRPELRVLADEARGRQKDPNRAVIELLKERAAPGDEILVTYEDVPFMYYMDNPIRGGIACFRVEDPSAPPRFAVIRRSVPFLHWPVFTREMGRHMWRRIPVDAPAYPWGNNPDPDTQPAWFHAELPDVIVAEYAGPAAGTGSASRPFAP